ncbi:NUDIX domain-containing protein [Actinomyces timonensis]|uniref:NUDIX domain-containing protein n=1 Tax=Actinomyces timonensis TaxID=1288391 RepID=UPI0002E6174B|nr:NUDIX domain-containing protein [Actinomyces timonensis]
MTVPPPASPVQPFALIPAAYLLLMREEAGEAAPSRRTRVLLQLRQSTGYMDGYWACGVAGHVDDGEPVTATAAREAAEEVGIVVDPDRIEPLTTLHRSNDVGGAALEQRVDFFFTARAWAGEPRIMESAKCAGLEWFSLADLPERVPPHERTILARLAAALDGGAPVPAILPFGFDGERIERYRVARPH